MGSYVPPDVFKNGSTSPNITVNVRSTSDITKQTGSRTPDVHNDISRAEPRMGHFTSRPSAASDSSKPPQMSAKRRIHLDLDLANSIHGLYRVLDLISEQGSGGLVDKVIIAQDGLKNLINELKPGAYAALTKVDFKALDTLTVRPIGIYGDRGEIIKFLTSLKIIDNGTRQLLQHSRDEYSGPILRSGIYIVKPQNQTSNIIYAIYWPQDTTWVDNATSGHRRNRVTFMRQVIQSITEALAEPSIRYLTKISEQLLCLISPSQSQALVWDHQEREEVEEDLEYASDDEDRLYTFEIAKTNEQEETVVSRPGFQIQSQLMTAGEATELEYSSSQLSPRLISGELTQGFLSAKVSPPRVDEKPIQGLFSKIRLKTTLTTSNIKIGCQVTEQEIGYLIDNGLLESARYKNICNSWQERRKVISKDIEKMKAEKMREVAKDFADEELLGKQLAAYLVGIINDIYPTVDVAQLKVAEKHSLNFEEISSLRSDFIQFAETHNKEELLPTKTIRDFEEKLRRLPKDFQDQKRLVAYVHTINTIFPNLRTEENIQNIIKDGLPKRLATANSYWTTARKWIPFASSTSPEDETILFERVKKAVDECYDGLSDADFLAHAEDYIKQEPLVEPVIGKAIDRACTYFDTLVNRTSSSITSNIHQKKEKIQRSKVQAQVDEQKEEAQNQSRALFIEHINSVAEDESLSIFVLTKFSISRAGYDCTLSATIKNRVGSSLEYSINKLELSSDHRHEIQLDPLFIPTPCVNPRNSAPFSIPSNYRIIHIQLLENNRILLIVDDQRGQFAVYLEDMVNIANALQYGRHKRIVHKDKVGQEILIAYDESKRILVFCSPDKLVLYVFLFDETLASLQSWATALELSAWYNNEVTITHVTFVTGTEEILLVDSTAQARIYSLVSQRFRPASLSLPRLPIAVMSTPDSACVLFAYQVEDERVLSAHHWDTFGGGETQGITIPLPKGDGGLAVTSFLNRNAVHVLVIDGKGGICQSVALSITKKSSEFMFKEKGVKTSSGPEKDGNYVNNCLINCFADVWIRFPVVAAVIRQSRASADRQQKMIVFVSDHVHDNYASYFMDMVKTFEEQTKKPTDGQLKAIKIEAKTFQETFENIGTISTSTISQFRAGKWFVDLLCLLPIHIAVARENRFVPLKDGVSSTEFERSLLGAEVGRIVDSLSFGWYESILRSYMADKPVKVVSSMGEQSVGKSFALNHLVDTSFAGSAMRTTEGVWMSITPTDEALLVALDFEGVHSIERSPQEDALLVLFNTAISNLVLFRNNFALSRDIANLFQSFQASSVILDPKANPSLFQSTLVIIIKDVVESDKREIVREFSLKFQKIVQEEQGANFISKLHAGKLNIIPWPVIESSQFYTLFSTLKRQLYAQKVTHSSAGEFLYTLKILMAKLKANDWGAMSQSLAAHRAQSLLNLLPTALQFGLAEASLDGEPLKNIDNDTVIDCPDTHYRFHISSALDKGDEREQTLVALQKTWDKYDTRQYMEESAWIEGLAAYLNEIAKMRIAHVEAWISINLQRFKASGNNVEILQRELANASVDLQANIEICKMTCAHCNLKCLLSRRHDPAQSHDCHTDHRCLMFCEFEDDHPGEQKSCNSVAGHDGQHICVIEDHLCGEPCIYENRNGCQGECTQVFNHEGDHHCSARKHACGEPCELQILNPNGTIKYSCPGSCTQPSDEEHDEHICDNRMCPISCELCKRLCAKADHLHGLNNAAVHLCGEDHRCHASCSAGICEIDTTPQSVEATFTGRHETFQYTKYTQVSKRLPCVKLIPAGKREHDGQHIHSLEASPFHFCDARCDSCGYFCTLPRGHPQQEHETSHGSMSKTRWLVDGPDGSAMELNGRRFGTNDEGAPMMCNLVCQSMGRHAHVDYCRTDASQKCVGPDHLHITERLAPNPDRSKDWISHALYWRRRGFRDPYSRDDQANFAKCDKMCSGPEHAATANQGAQPSYCTQPLFHPPQANDRSTGLGYVSNDGHVFSCKNPIVMQQAFHVIFVIDRSGSMAGGNRTPLPATPMTPNILRRHNNRLGAVYLSLYSFWQSRQVALNSQGSSGASAARRDSYSVILFHHAVSRCIENDFQRTPEDLLNTLLSHEASGGTNYTTAIADTESVMRQHWSTERTPVVIFLSDGECGVQDSTMRTLCRASISFGKPLSFHAVSFGPRNEILRRMSQIASEVEVTAPRDPLLPANARVPSSYNEALDSVRLAETFLGIADSLQKPRGALMLS